MLADKRLDFPRTAVRVLIRRQEPVVERLGFEPLIDRTPWLALIRELAVVPPLAEELSGLAIPNGQWEGRRHPPSNSRRLIPVPRPRNGSRRVGLFALPLRRTLVEK